VADTGWAKAAWGSLFGQWHERACVVLCAMKPDPERVLDLLSKYRISSFCAPPTLYRSLVQVDFEGRDLSSLRHCTSAGEPLNPEVIHAWRKSTGGLTVYEGYGQTETTCVVANYRSAEVRAGSMGRPVPGWEIDIVDDEGRAIETGAVGSVVVRSSGPQVGLFPGYHEDAGATAECMRGDLYFTGDRAALDADGYFWFEGRSDDVITSSAYRIGPFEVESALVAHPAVVEAAVVGRDDPKRTQVVVGVCVLAADFEPSPELARELQDFVKDTTAPYKYPREVHFVTELPKTVSGKIRRGELRDWLLDGRLPKP
jgi:acyl-coenzyme A synthetase/AMP-(fatty) acid ligase